MFTVRNGVLISLGVSILSLIWSRIPCYNSETDQLMKIAKEYHRIVAQGIPGKVDPSDPLHIDEVPGSKGDLRFTLKNITMYGLKDCSPELLKVDSVHLVFIYRFDCSKLFMTKAFEVNGVLAQTAVDDQGEGNVTMIDYSFLLYGDLNEVYDENGQIYYQINSFNFKVKVRGHTKIVNESYIKGNYEKYKAVYKFVEDDSKEAQAVFRPVLMKSLLSKYINNINSFIKEHNFL